MSEKKAPRPVTRQELSRLQVTDADAFTGLRFLRHRDGAPALVRIEERGDTRHPGSVGCLADLYHALWAPEPQVREESQVPADRRWWRQLLASTVSTAGYQELHAATQLSELKSVLGTVTMGETVLAHVSDEDAQKLQELAGAQAEADAAAEEASQMQAEADALAAAAGEMERSGAAGPPSSSSNGGNGQGSAQAPQGAKAGQGQPTMPQKSSLSGGMPGGEGQLTAEQAKQLVDELAEQWASAQERAEAAKAKADAAKARAEAQACQMLGEPGSAEAVEKMRELARIGQAALRDAQAKVEDVSSTIEAWGLEEGELTQAGIPEALGLLERMKRSPALKKFAALLGRIRKIAAKKAASKSRGEGQRESRLETGRDIRRAIPRELVAFAVGGASRVQALKRWARGELQLRGERSREKLGHGPVVVCEDGSGSMDGAKQQWAKAVTLSLAHFAKLQRRGFGWMLFDYGVRAAKSYPAGRLSAQQLLEIAEARSGGGTNFEAPLRRAVEMIRSEGLKRADIVFITDGECAVSEAFLVEFRAAKKALEFNVVTVLCDVGSAADSAVREFSDRVEKVSAFSAEEAESKIFNNL